MPALQCATVARVGEELRGKAGDLVRAELKTEPRMALADT